MNTQFPLRKIIGPKLKQKGMSQRALARELGLDPAVITNLLSGKRKLSFDDARRLAKIFGLSLNAMAKQMEKWEFSQLL